MRPARQEHGENREHRRRRISGGHGPSMWPNSKLVVGGIDPVVPHAAEGRLRHLQGGAAKLLVLVFLPEEVDEVLHLGQLLGRKLTELVVERRRPGSAGGDDPTRSGDSASSARPAPGCHSRSCPLRSAGPRQSQRDEGGTGRGFGPGEDVCHVLSNCLDREAEAFRDLAIFLAGLKEDGDAPLRCR